MEEREKGEEQKERGLKSKTEAKGKWGKLNDKIDVEESKRE